MSKWLNFYIHLKLIDKIQYKYSNIYKRVCQKAGRLAFPVSYLPTHETLFLKTETNP